MTKFAIANVLPGQLNAMVKNIMRQMNITDPNEAVRRINAHEWIVTQTNPSWRERNGVIYFGVTSDGTSGSAWVSRLTRKGFRVADHAAKLLCSKEFVSTSGVTYNIAVMKGELWNKSERNFGNVANVARDHAFEVPGPEIACLIREKFTNDELEAMGLTWITVMHKPIHEENVNGKFHHLAVDRYHHQFPYLSTNSAVFEDDEWHNEENGFAYIVSTAS